MDKMLDVPQDLLEALLANAQTRTTILAALSTGSRLNFECCDQYRKEEDHAVKEAVEQK